MNDNYKNGLFSTATARIRTGSILVQNRMWLITIIFVLLTLFIVLVKWRMLYWKRRGLTQLDTEFFLGNFRKILTGKVPMSEAFLDFYFQFKRMGVKHGGIYSILDPIYIPVDPKIIKNILQKDFSHFLGHGFYHDASDILSMHLFNLEGEPWKQLRAKLTPTFTSGKIKLMLGTLLEKSKDLQKVMDNVSVKNEPVQIKDILSRYTTDIIGSCAFGIECNSLEDPECNFKKVGLKALEMNLLLAIFIGITPWSILRAIKFNVSPPEVTKFFSKIVKDTIQYREKNNISRKDFMQLLIQLKNKGILTEETTQNENSVNTTNTMTGNVYLTENEIIAQCFIFFLGGFETSSTTMTFALLELAQNMDIQEKLRGEINEVLKKYNGEISYEAVMEMTYLEKVIYETLRKYPPVPVLPRRCCKDYQIPDTDIVIRKGIAVQIPVWGIHRDPDYYPNPDVFNPENFSDEAKASRPDFTFLPFGEGPRMCIGLRFGMLQTKVGLISILTRYRLTLNEKTTLPITMDKHFILTVKGDVWLNVTKI